MTLARPLVTASLTPPSFFLDPQMMRVDVVKFNPRFGICKLDAKAYVGEQVVCEGQLTLVMAK